MMVQLDDGRRVDEAFIRGEGELFLTQSQAFLAMEEWKSKRHWVVGPTVEFIPHDRKRCAHGHRHFSLFGLYVDPEDFEAAGIEP